MTCRLSKATPTTNRIPETRIKTVAREIILERLLTQRSTQKATGITTRRDVNPDRDSAKPTIVLRFHSCSKYLSNVGPVATVEVNTNNTLIQIVRRILSSASSFVAGELIGGGCEVLVVALP
jgi:hypothetical protein